MPKTIAYWILTVLVCFAMGLGGVIDLVQPDDMKEQLKQMQMPLYFFSILGFWKVLGVVALLIPKCPTLKEWAYAGFTFNLTGASACHYFAGHDATKIIVPLVIWGLVMMTWYLRPASRRYCKPA